MRTAQQVDVDISDLELTDPDGRRTRLADLDGVSVLVLMRHRH